MTGHGESTTCPASTDLWSVSYATSTSGTFLNFSNEAVEAIKEATACNPFFLQMICRELVEAARRERSCLVCELDVNEIMQLLIQRGKLEERYVRHLYSPFDKPDPLDMAIIAVVARSEIENRRPHFVSQRTIVESIIPQQHDQVITRIGDLQRRDILSKSPNDSPEVRITLPLFRDWFNGNQPQYKLWAPMLRK